MHGTPKVSAGLQETYDGYYSGESEWRMLGAKDKAQHIVELCAGVSPAEILDLGAGEGSVLQSLSTLNFGRNYFAAEISDSGVAAIRNRGVKNLVEVIKFDGYSLPYEDQRFDLCIASHVLEHIEHERLFLREAARVARFLFIEVPLEDTLRLGQKGIRNEIGHINFYNYKSLRRLVESCNAEIICQKLFDLPLSIVKYHNTAFDIPKFLLRRGAFLLNGRIASKVFTYHCALLCQTR